MLNDKQNNFHWKNKLEDVGSLFDESLPDKNTAWEKLHARLHEQPQHKAFAWYWIAAACLLLAVIIPAITMNKKLDDVVINTATTTEPQQKNIPEISIQKENEVVKIAPTTDKIKNIVKTIVAKKESVTVVNDITVNQETEVTSSNDKIAVQESIILAIPFIDSTNVNTLAAIPAKKKIKVVHVNELGEVIEVSPDLVRNTDIHAFQLKLATQEVYKTPSVASSNSSITFKKKPPSK